MTNEWTQSPTSTDHNSNLLGAHSQMELQLVRVLTLPAICQLPWGQCPTRGKLKLTIYQLYPYSWLLYIEPSRQCNYRPRLVLRYSGQRYLRPVLSARYMLAIQTDKTDNIHINTPRSPSVTGHPLYCDSCRDTTGDRAE